MAHDNAITFYRVTIEHMVLHLKNIQRRHGLELFFGGGQPGAALAEVMGDDGDIAACATKETALVCQDCGITGGCLASIFESMANRKPAEESKQIEAPIAEVNE